MPISGLKIDNRGQLLFIWKPDEKDGMRMVVRNRLTKKEYFSREFTQSSFALVTQQGLSCYEYGIPTDMPLEVTLETPDGEIQYPDCTGLGGCIQLRYGESVITKGVWWKPWEKTYINLIYVEVPCCYEEIDFPDNLVYLRLYSDRGGEARRVYLPKLTAGENTFCYQNIPEGYSFDTRTLYFNDAPEMARMVGMLRLVRVRD